MALISIATGGPVLLGVLIAATVYLKWPNKVQYLWAAIIIIWGIFMGLA